VHCLVWRLFASLFGAIGKLPEQISAVRITFPKSDAHTVHILILIAVCAQGYLLVVFALSAIGDYLLWRRALRESIKAYAAGCRNEVGEAVDLAVDELKKVPWRVRKLEASDNRMKYAFGLPIDKREGVIRIIWNTHPWTIVYLLVLFPFPVFWSLLSIISLLTWTPSIR
jgi:hypothetical protein